MMRLHTLNAASAYMHRDTVQIVQYYLNLDLEILEVVCYFMTAEKRNDIIYVHLNRLAFRKTQARFIRMNEMVVVVARWPVALSFCRV